MPNWCNFIPLKHFSSNCIITKYIILLLKNMIINVCNCLCGGCTSLWNHQKAQNSNIVGSTTGQTQTNIRKTQTSNHSKPYIFFQTWTSNKVRPNSYYFIPFSWNMYEKWIQYYIIRWYLGRYRCLFQSLNQVAMVLIVMGFAVQIHSGFLPLEKHLEDKSRTYFSFVGPLQF